jgi:hypothetical protein
MGNQKTQRFFVEFNTVLGLIDADKKLVSIQF